MTPPAAAAAAAPAVRARTAAPGRPLTTTPRPRRVSGPVRPASPSRRTPSAPGLEASGEGVVLGLLAALRHVSRHRLLDRLIRGRAWIALVAFALIGIVTLQLGLLKLNAAIGRSLEHSALLQRENAALSIENSELAAGSRVEAAAGHLGMQLVAPGALRFLTARPRVDASQAAAELSTPIHAAPTSSEEASSASSGAPSSETPSSGSSTSATGSEQSSSSETTPTSTAAQAPSTPSTPSTAGTESSSAGGEPAKPSGESAPATESSSPTAAPTSLGAASQATPAGGTQAAPGG
jgi:cell division protein FtsL